MDRICRNHHHTAIVSLFIELLDQDWEVSISHIYHEGNKCADYLVSYGHCMPSGTHLVPVSYMNLNYFLLYDYQGLPNPVWC
ncbi:unnamed protein product [Linum tenue]|uniref:RNase H type-1 domain-containing protein n=1 Tax=Linum tenue TaxID=586396 RepID=A0AAV0NZV2_9ROSI|nr:unnamed protein product [Linum tenue]